MLSSYYCEYLLTDFFVFWKLFFEGHLVLDVKKTFRLQKLYCKNVWWKHIRNESCNCYLGNRYQNANFLVVSRSDNQHSFFNVSIGRTSKFAHPKNWAPRNKFVHPCIWNYIGLKVHLWYEKYRNLKKFVIEVFKVKFDLSPELMNDIFKFVEKPYSLRINSQFRTEDKICHRNIKKIWHRMFLQMNVKISSSFWVLRQKRKLRFQKTVVSFMQSIYINQIGFI